MEGMENYYYVEINTYEPTVYCDDWTQSINDLWLSYVVYPHGQNGANVQTAGVLRGYAA